MNLENKTDEELIKLTQDNSDLKKEVISIIYTRYNKCASNIARKILHVKYFNKQDIEDVTQDIFLKFMKNVDKFDYKNKSFSNWFSTLAYRYTLSFLRLRLLKDKKKKNLISDYDKDDKHDYILHKKEQSTFKMPDELLDYEAICNEMDKLPENPQRILELYYQHGFQYNEISEILDISIGTVKSRKSRAIEKLKERFEKDLAIY